MRRSGFVATFAVFGGLLGCRPDPPPPAETPAIPSDPLSPPGPEASASPPVDARKFGLFFPDSHHPDWEKTCAAVSEVERTLPKSEWSPKRVLETLLAGPTEAERAAGLQDPYAASFSQSPATRRLGSFFRGVQLDPPRAIVDFSGPAMGWLNAAACKQEAVKAPIELTLREAFGVTKVEYSIDGRVVDAWDA